MKKIKFLKPITWEQNLINLSLKHTVSKFCHVSSIATLSNSNNNNSISESDWFSINEKKSHYAHSKYLEKWKYGEGLMKD